MEGFTPADIAVANVEALLRGEITEPSEGTLAARVLAWAKDYGKPTVTITLNGCRIEGDGS